MEETGFLVIINILFRNKFSSRNYNIIFISVKL